MLTYKCVGITFANASFTNFTREKQSMHFVLKKMRNLLIILIVAEIKKKCFMMSPVDFARVSSGFGHRKHPILIKWKKHNGVDYAKNRNPVMTTANGIINFVDG